MQYPPEDKKKILEDRCLLVCALGTLESQYAEAVFAIDTPEKRSVLLDHLKELWNKEAQLLGNPLLATRRGKPLIKCSIQVQPYRIYYKLDSHTKNARINQAMLEKWSRENNQTQISFKQLSDLVTSQLNNIK
jgi:hypothetical protein